MDYKSKIEEAKIIQEKYLAIGSVISKTIGKTSKHSPNYGVNAIAKHFLYAGSKMAGQIIGALEIGHIQLAMVGLRTLFEMSVNATYTYNHPQKAFNKKHMRQVCRSIVYQSNKKRNARHTKLDGKPFKQRLIEVKMGHLYNKNYRIMSDWAHLMMHVIMLNDQNVCRKLGVDIAAHVLYAQHNIFDSICACYKFPLDPKLQESVEKYEPKVDPV